MEGGAHGAAFTPDETDDINDTPTVLEYKKLKRVMRIMIKFYEDGSNAKLSQAEDVSYELKKVETDLSMVESQLEALKPFPSHPKKNDYEKELLEERDALSKARASYTSKYEQFKGLHEWSLGIVDATRWLAGGLDDYCVNHLKMDLNITPVPLERPSVELYKKYRKGLEEIHENLHESQDFFSASLDGRLKKYHQIEKDIIEAQLKAIADFPPMNPRKAHMEEELQKDLEFVTENMKESPSSTAKRERMLSMHKDFVTVLSWFKNKLDDFAVELGVSEENGQENGKENGKEHGKENGKEHGKENGKENGHVKPESNKTVDFIQQHLSQ